jgi:hypothetical protein
MAWFVPQKDNKVKPILAKRYPNFKRLVQREQLPRNRSSL